jgi:hypothetical protein
MRATILPTLIAILVSTTAHGAGVLTRVSTSSGGAEGSGNSLLPALSADGR